MWSSTKLKLSMTVQSFIRYQNLKLNNHSIQHLRNLHNLKNWREYLVGPLYFYKYFNYFPQNISNINKFSTTNVLSKSKDRGKEKKKSQATHVDLREMAEVMNVEHMMSQLDKVIDDFKDQMIKNVSLRTAAGSLEELTVNYDGDEYKLQELAEINRKPKMIVLNLSSFPQTISSILETLQKSQMNLNPQQEGTTLYIPIPKVTKEHREGLAKSAKAYFVKCKDNINDIRNKHIKSLKKQSNLPTDLTFRVEGYISSLSHEYVDKAEKLLETKQKELLGES